MTSTTRSLPHHAPTYFLSLCCCCYYYYFSREIKKRERETVAPFGPSSPELLHTASYPSGWLWRVAQVAAGRLYPSRFFPRTVHPLDLKNKKRSLKTILWRPASPSGGCPGFLRSVQAPISFVFSRVMYRQHPEYKEINGRSPETAHTFPPPLFEPIYI